MDRFGGEKCKAVFGDTVRRGVLHRLAESPENPVSDVGGEYCLRVEYERRHS